MKRTSSWEIEQVRIDPQVPEVSPEKLATLDGWPRLHHGMWG